MKLKIQKRERSRITRGANNVQRIQTVSDRRLSRVKVKMGGRETEEKLLRDDASWGDYQLIYPADAKETVIDEKGRRARRG